jgi:hypothetical protein
MSRPGSKNLRTLSAVALSVTAGSLLASATLISPAGAVQTEPPTAENSTIQLRSGEQLYPLAAKAENCYIRKNDKFNKKTQFTAVPCEDPAHNVEVFWSGKVKVKKKASKKQRQQRTIATCTKYYRSINNGRNKSYAFYFATSKRDVRKYGAHATCFYAGKKHGSLKPLGAGWHVLGR